MYNKIYHTVWKMTERNNKDKTLDEQEIHFIELPKFLKTKVDTKRKLDQWLLFIDYSRKELLKMAEENNKVLREAAVEYEYLTGEEEVQRLAFLRRKFELDYNSGLQYAEEKRITADEVTDFKVLPGNGLTAKLQEKTPQIILHPSKKSQI